MFYIMELKIFGQKLRVEICIICILIGWFIGVSTWCGAAGGVKEGMTAAMDLTGAAVNYTMGKGVSGSWDTPDGTSGDYNSWYKNLEGNTAGLPLPLKDDQLSMFAANQFSPNCCPSTYTGSMGCLCATPEQMKYLNERGGNRTLNTEF